MKIKRVTKNERVIGITVETGLLFSQHIVSYLQRQEFPFEKKRGQNLTYRIELQKRMFSDRGERVDVFISSPGNREADAMHIYYNLLIRFGSGCLRDGETYRKRKIALKTEKLLSKLGSFMQKNQKEMASYVTFAGPLRRDPMSLHALLKKDNSKAVRDLTMHHMKVKAFLEKLIESVDESVQRAQMLQH